MFKEFLDLGRHPIANAFLKEGDFDDEFFFDLKQSQLDNHQSLQFHKLMFFHMSL